MKTWNVQFQEDELFNEEVIRVIEKYHNFKFVKAVRHAVVDKLEVDVVAYFVTPTYQRRVIGFELKENDIWKALNQAFKRAKHFNYFYIVINSSPAWLFDWLIHSNNRVGETFEDIRKHKIGIFCRNQLIIPARYRKIGLEKFADFKVKKKGYCQDCKYVRKSGNGSLYCIKRWKRVGPKSSCVDFEPRGTEEIEDFETVPLSKYIKI